MLIVEDIIMLRNELILFAVDIVGNKQDAEDIVHDAFLSCINMEFNDELHARRLLFKRVKCRCINIIEKRDRTRKIKEQLEEQFGNIIFLEPDERKQPKLDLSTLTFKERQLLFYLYTKGESPKNVGSKVNVSHATVRSMKRRIIDKLKYKNQ